MQNFHMCQSATTIGNFHSDYEGKLLISPVFFFMLSTARNSHTKANQKQLVQFIRFHFSAIHDQVKLHYNLPSMDDSIGFQWQVNELTVMDLNDHDTGIPL